MKICIDTGVLIDYHRKTIVERSFWYELSQTYSDFSVSVITQYEIFTGSNPKQEQNWITIFDKLSILPISPEVCQIAVETERLLKRKRKSIDLKDLFIAATCLQHKLPLATLNVKHFENIDDLQIIPPNIL